MNSLFDLYQQPLLAFFNGFFHNIFDAEDSTQEVFYKIFRSKNYRKIQYNKAMVFAVAWNVLRDKQRRDKSHRRDWHISADNNFETEDPITIEQTVNSEKAYRRFFLELDVMSPAIRTALILRCFEGLSNKQIAEHCHISLSAVEKRIKSALLHLKGNLAPPTLL